MKSGIKAIDYEEAREDKPIDLEKHPYGAFMKEWTKSERRGVFSLNLGAVHNFKQALALLDLDRGGYLRLSDYGYTSAKILRKAMLNPKILMGKTRVGGQPTAQVNMPLLQFEAGRIKDIEVSVEESNKHVNRWLGMNSRAKTILDDILLYSRDLNIPRPLRYWMRNDLAYCTDRWTNKGQGDQWIDRDALVESMVKHDGHLLAGLGYQDVRAAAEKFVDDLFKADVIEEEHSDYHMKVCSAQFAAAQGKGSPAKQTMDARELDKILSAL